MTDVNCFTSEHTTTTATTTEAGAATTLTTPTKNVAPSVSPTSPFVLRAPPSAKSKLILQNMEEVLNSVKQKHREKHKRKREEKRRAAMLAEQAGAAGAVEPEDPATKITSNSGSNNSSSTKTSNGRHVLREKTANGKRKSATSPLKCSTPNTAAGEDQQTSIKKHFAKTESKKGTTTTGTTEKATKPATNVFELMMSARNRSIGSNANGSHHSPEEEAAPQGSTPRTKRKQLLQEWNERKGGTKRRQADDARGEYIDQQMEQRAKR